MCTSRACSAQHAEQVSTNGAGSKFLKFGPLQLYHALIRHFLLLDLRFLAKFGRRQALPADVMLHIVTAAIGRRR